MGLTLESIGIVG